MSWLYYIVQNVYQVLLIHYNFIMIMLGLNLPAFNISMKINHLYCKIVYRFVTRFNQLLGFSEQLINTNCVKMFVLQIITRKIFINRKIILHCNKEI